MKVYVRWVSPLNVRPFKWWVLHRWCDHSLWHKGEPWDGMRIMGFEFINVELN